MNMALGDVHTKFYMEVMDHHGDQSGTIEQEEFVGYFKYLLENSPEQADTVLKEVESWIGLHKAQRKEAFWISAYDLYV